MIQDIFSEVDEISLVLDTDGEFAAPGKILSKLLDDNDGILTFDNTRIVVYHFINNLYRKQPDIYGYLKEIIDRLKRDSTREVIVMNTLRYHWMSKWSEGAYG